MGSEGQGDNCPFKDAKNLGQIRFFRAKLFYIILKERFSLKKSV